MSPKTDKRRWFEREAAPGVVMIAAAVLSFALQNSSAREAFDALLHAGVTLHAGPLEAHISLAHVINDALMAVFFLYVGLDLKRECMEGPFRSARTAALPAFGALGGMIAPAIIYLAIAAPANPDYVRGWAIPTATDIAFTLGVMALLGSRVAPGMRLFILALAIIDDLGAILIIAVFYSSGIVGWALGAAALTFIAMLAMNRFGVRALLPYWIAGLALWGFIALSGVHATMAGVLTALAVPMCKPSGASPLIAAEHSLKHWVHFLIMPAFALANAGASLAGGFGALAHPVALAVMAGLVFGKTLGVSGATLLAAAALKRAPPCDPLRLIGLSMLAGIGFTMSLFIGGLAFGSGPEAAPLRLGVMAGSLISASAGFALLFALGRQPGASDPDLAAQEHVAEDRGVLDKS